MLKYAIFIATLSLFSLPNLYKIMIVTCSQYNISGATAEKNILTLSMLVKFFSNRHFDFVLFFFFFVSFHFFFFFFFFCYFSQGNRA